MTTEKTWKYWTLRTLIAVLFISLFWVGNLIWFKPFSIRHFYDRAFVELAFNDPELTTSMGIPVLYDMSKDELTDVSDQRQWDDFNRIKENYKTLMSYDFKSQSTANQLNTKILGWFLKNQIDGEPYFYHSYPVNQMSGVQSQLPSLLENSHKLRNKSDVEAYISRLTKFGAKFEQVIEGLKIRQEKNIIPPKFIIARVLSEMNGFIGETEPDPIHSNILYTNFDTKIDKIGELTDEEKQQYKQRVAEAIGQDVFKAYQQLIGYFKDLDTQATTDAGVWKFPNGDNFYKYQLRSHTTTDLSPEQVHQIGLAEVARITEEMRTLLSSQGYLDTTLSMGQLIQQINREEQFLFPDNDDGRTMILVRYQSILDEIDSKLSDVFDIRPKAGLEVKRVPKFKEEGSARAYYNRPAMDGSRGGIFYANLRDVHETSKMGMKTLAYHEGIPGHHFQIAIQSELEGVPIFRTIGLFTAFIEGWALYSERLAWELGFYEDDAIGNLGRLQAEMFRAVRLVVDTGIHYKRWTKKEAIEYMVARTGMPESEVVTEIERYIVMPGQACSYKIGMMKILELRERAKSSLGEKFDIKRFHNVVLKNGAVPLDILEVIVDGFIESQQYLIQRS